jgi:hypothetical protein
VCSTNPARIASCTRRHLLILAQAHYLSHDNYRRLEMSIYFPVQKCIPDWRPSNGWMPRTLKRVRAKGSSDHASASAGLSDAQINKWYIKLIEEHILTTICRKLHAEYGTLLLADYRPQMSELELAWVLHSAIFYYSVRKHIFQLPVFDDHSAFIERTVDLFLSGAARHVAKAALPDPHAQHSRLSTQAIERQA